MTLVSTEGFLQHFYEALVCRQQTEVFKRLARRVVYVGLASGSQHGSVRGQVGVQLALGELINSFAGVQIKGLRVESHSEQVGRIQGARFCFRVTYTLMGRSTKALMGSMYYRARASRKPSLSMTDVVWLDSERQIIHISSTSE